MCKRYSDCVKCIFCSFEKVDIFHTALVCDVINDYVPFSEHQCLFFTPLFDPLKFNVKKLYLSKKLKKFNEDDMPF